MADKNMEPHEQDLWPALVNKYTGVLYQWAFFKVANADLAKDLIRDTFITAKKGWSRFAENKNEKRLLFSILNSKILDFHRRNFIDNAFIQPLTDAPRHLISYYLDENGNWRKERILSTNILNALMILKNENQLEVWAKKLVALPDSWHSVLQLRYFQTQYGRDIVADLRLSEQNLLGLIRNAKLQLSTTETND